MKGLDLWLGGNSAEADKGALYDGSALSCQPDSHDDLYPAYGACHAGLFAQDARAHVLDHAAPADLLYFDQTPRGDIISRFTNDTDSLRQVVSQSLPNLLSCGLTVLGVLCMMVYYSLPLMLVVILGIVCMTLATKNIGGKSAKYLSASRTPSAKQKASSRK